MARPPLHPWEGSLYVRPPGVTTRWARVPKTGQSGHSCVTTARRVHKTPQSVQSTAFTAEWRGCVPWGQAGAAPAACPQGGAPRSDGRGVATSIFCPAKRWASSKVKPRSGAHCRSLQHVGARLASIRDAGLEGVGVRQLEELLGLAVHPVIDPADSSMVPKGDDQSGNA